MTDEFRYDVFLSHSNKDRSINRASAKRLHNVKARRFSKSKTQRLAHLGNNKPVLSC